MSLFKEVSDRREVCRTAHTVVQRARWRRHGVHLSIIIKQVLPSSADELRIGQLEHEFHVLQALAGQGAPTALDLFVENGVPHLILADSGGVALRELLASDSISTERMLGIAIRAADALQRLHDRDVVHQDISPDHLIVFGAQDEVQWIDFGCASIRSTESRAATPEVIRQGSPTYMSPEQAGRSGRTDSRSDLYSLGATLYEAFVGTPPFQTDDLLEIIHAHLAKQPSIPEGVSASLPQDLNRILLKLLAKNSDNRYQTAFGVRSDLERCFDRNRGIGSSSPMRLGADDDRSRLRLPGQLYGREIALGQLLDAFVRVKNGAVESLLIAGHSGIGKTSLVKEVQRPLKETGGYFSEGKFDQFNRRIPYKALQEAVRGLIRQVLVADSAVLETFRQSILTALDGNGRVLIDVLPEIEMVVGTQPPVPGLGVAEARERFRSTFLAFIRACATKERPLVVFLDDVQWADPPTLELIHALTCTPGTEHLLLLLAYRDNEVFDGHPLRAFEREVRESGASFGHVRLENLNLQEVTRFVGDALSMPSSSVTDLAELCLAKTSGNPFFLGQLLISLHRERLISYDAHSNGFRWDLAKLVRAPISDNVVDLMVEKFRELPEDTQQALRLAACLGNRFDLNRLAILMGTSVRGVANTLWPATSERYVLAEDEAFKPSVDETTCAVAARYRFAHDRLQQAAYELIAEEELTSIHYEVGKALWTGNDIDGPDECLFDIVNHFELSKELVTDPQERSQLIALARSAFEKAKRANAFSAALKYIQFAIELMGNNAWERAPAEMLQATLDWAICEHMNGNLTVADDLFRTALEHATTPVERAHVRFEMELLFLHVGSHDRVIQLVMTTLRELGFEVPSEDDPQAIRASATTLRDRAAVLLGDRAIRDLCQLDQAWDPVAIEAHRHLRNLAPSAFFKNMDLYLWLGAKNFELTLRSGHTPWTPFNLSVSGLADLVRGKLDVAYELGELGVKLSDDQDSSASRADCYFHFCLINSWRHHFRGDEEHAKKAYAFAVESWHHSIVSWATYAHVRALTLMGTPLYKIRELAEEYIPVVAETNRENTAFLLAAERMASCLSGKTLDGSCYDSENFVESIFVREASNYENPAPVFNYFIFKLQSLFVLGDFDDARRILAAAEPYESTQWVEITEYYFFRGLIASVLCDTAIGEERAQWVNEIQSQTERLKGFAEQNPENFECRSQLLGAELARVEGDQWKALANYRAASRSASEGGFLQIEAIAEERLARLWLAHGENGYAEPHFAAAVACYRRWGATRKLDQLLAEQRTIWGQATAEEVTTTPSNPVAEQSTSRLDIATVMKASQAISTEIVLDRLLENMLNVVVENAGATRGLFLLPDDQSWLVAAEWTASEGAVKCDPSPSLDDFTSLAHAVTRYVERTRQPLCVSVASDDPRFEQDPYIQSTGLRSVLCIPVQHQGRITAMLYLENEHLEGAFVQNHVELLGLLSSQVAFSIENAKVYAELEDRVAERTRELAASNDFLKTVFDNAAQGLVLVDRDGKLVGEPPAVLQRWFHGGVPETLSGFFAADQGTQTLFELAWEQLTQEFLPLEVCIEQLPSEVRVRQDRILEFAYRPIPEEDNQMGSMLVVVSDVTVERENAKAELRQRQLMTIFEKVSRDPQGVQEFLSESESMINELIRGVSGSEVDRRLVHTLKANTAMYGLEEISSLCHQLECGLIETDCELQPSQRMELAESWLKARLDIERFMRQGGGIVRVPRDEYERLLSDMEAANDPFLESLSLWTLESDHIRLERIGQQVQQLAGRLGKMPVKVELESAGVYYPNVSWPSFFSALVHVVRNAVDHGLETQQERLAVGKTDARIGLRSIVTADNEYVLEVEDDGRGIDWPTIREKAIACGLPAETPEDLRNALFREGLSTREEATQVSGRGVGMGAMREACDEMGATIEVESAAGKGTCWRFRFPITSIRRADLQKPRQLPRLEKEHS